MLGKKYLDTQLECLYEAIEDCNDALIANLKTLHKCTKRLDKLEKKIDNTSSKKRTRKAK